MLRKWLGLSFRKPWSRLGPILVEFQAGKYYRDSVKVVFLISLKLVPIGISENEEKLILQPLTCGMPQGLKLLSFLFNSYMKPLEEVILQCGNVVTSGC